MLSRKILKAKKIVSLVIFFCVCSAALNGADLSSGNSDKIPILVSVQPQAYFVKRIGGQRTSVLTLVPPGKNPVVYAPSPWQISRVAKAKIFFRIGVPFEAFFLPKLKSIYKDMMIVNTQKGIKLRKMEGGHLRRHESESGHFDRHKGEGGHSDPHESEGADPHTWLSPVLVQKQAKTICRALIRLDPSGKEVYQSNLESFLKDLKSLDDKIRRSLAPVRGSSLLVFHPSFGYLADEYHLKQVAVEVEGKSPKVGDISFLIKKAKKEKIKVIFVQSQFDRSVAAKIAAAINGSVIDIDPLARDYIKNLEAMAKKISSAIGTNGKNYEQP